MAVLAGAHLARDVADVGGDRVPAATGASVRPVAAGTSFEVVTSAARLAEIEAEWTDLYERAGTSQQVFQSFNICWHWVQVFAPDDRRGGRLAVVTGRLDGRLVLVWPLIQHRSAGLTILSWLGAPVAQYGDIVVDPMVVDAAFVDHALRAAIDQLGPDLIRLRKVRDDAQVRRWLEDRGAIVTAEAEAPYLDLKSADSFEAYCNRYSGKARKNRRRLMRRLEEQAPVEIAAPRSADAARTVIGRALALKRAWLRSRGLVSKAMSDVRFQKFLERAASDTGRPVACEISTLTSGGEIASVQIGFRAKRRLAMHIIVYSLDFEKCGVGVLHLEDAIRRCYEQKTDTLDLLAPKAPYKMEWADGTVTVRDYALAITPLGRVYMRVYLNGLRPAVGRVADLLPAPWRRVLASVAVLALAAVAAMSSGC